MRIPAGSRTCGPANLILRIAILPALFLAVFPARGAAQGHETVRIEIPSNEIEKSVNCSAEEGMDLLISYGQQNYDGRFFRFASTPVLNEGVVCRRFMRLWASRLSAMPPHGVAFEVIRSPGAAGEQGSNTIRSSEMEEACRSLGLCAVSLLDRFGLDTALTSCQPPVQWSSIVEQVRPRLLRARYQLIPKVEIGYFPLEPLLAQVKEFAAAHPQETMLITTMSLGFGSLTDLSRVNRLARLFIAFDGSVVVQDEAAKSIPGLFPAESPFRFIPMTSGSSFESNFHWKGIVGLRSGDSILSSMNLSTPARAPYIDQSYRFTNPGVSAELRGYFLETMRDQCLLQPATECLVDFIQSNPAEQAAWKELSRRGCRDLEGELAALSSSPADPPYFMQPQNTDMPELLSELIDGAQSEVVVLSPKINHHRILEALERADHRGVRVLAFESENQYGDKLPPYLFLTRAAIRFRRMPDPHMKAIVIDRKKLLFGTGNFTYNGLLKARELFGVTEDNGAVQEVLRIAAAYYRAMAPDRPESFGLGPAKRHIMIPNDTPVQYLPKSRRQAALILLRTITSMFPESWLSGYRTLDPRYYPVIRECGLGHLELLLQDDLVHCLAGSNEDLTPR